MERFTLILMATVDRDGNISDETRIFSSRDLGTAIVELKKYGDLHCLITETFDGLDWLYVEDSEIFN